MPIGEVDGVDVSGLSAAVVPDTPKVMTDGNWRLGLIVDAAASDEQADKLTAVFPEQAGRPMAALAPLVGEVIGIERASVTIAKPTSSRISAFGMEFQNEGRSAFSAPFSWAG